MAAEEFLYPTETIVLRGTADEMVQWTTVLNQQYAPRRLQLAIPNDATMPLGALAGYAAVDSGIVAYVCREGRCLPPVNNLAELQRTVSV